MNRLLDSQVRSLRPKQHKYRKSDGDSLYVAVHPSGRKTFELRITDEKGRSTYEKVGDYPALSLRNARIKASTRRADLERQRTQQLAFSDVPESDRPPLTFGELLRDFYENHIESEYRRPEQVLRNIDRTDSSIAAIPIFDLDTAQTRDFRMKIAAYLRGRVSRSGPVAANRLMSIYKQATRYGVVHGFVNVDPLRELTPRYVGGSEKARERVLSDEEINALWHSKSAHTPLLRFLLATGQRIGEAQRARPDHLVGDRWVIPAEHAKNKREHWVPLTGTLRDLVPDTASSQPLFGTYTATAVQAWLKRWCERENVDPRFTPHDLRRTFKTRLTALKIPSDVVETMLNHTRKGLDAVYNQHDWAPERFDAQESWLSEIRRIVGND